MLPSIAEWTEVQSWEPFQQLAEEGTWCHSFVMLYSGTVEARGRVYRIAGATNAGGKGGGANGKSSAALRGKSSRDLVGGKEGKEGSGAANGSGEADAAADAENAGHAASSTSLLPVPSLVGPYDALAPVLLYPGATFGEAAIAGARFPHTCSVRTLERCTLLVLRRSKLENEISKLPVTARLGWEYESKRMMRMYAGFSARWRHHNLRRLRISKGLAPKLLYNLERLAEYRLVPAGTTLLRHGEGIDHLSIVLAGQVGIYAPAAAADEDDGGEGGSSSRPSSALFFDEFGDPLPPSLVRRVMDSSDVPLVGESPLLLPTAAEARSKPPSETLALTHTEVQMVVLPYEELSRRTNLLTELRKRVNDAREQPSTLMSLLQPPAGSRSLRQNPAAAQAAAAASGGGAGGAAGSAAGAGAGANRKPPPPTIASLTSGKSLKSLRPSALVAVASTGKSPLERGINALETLTGRDLDGDGDVGVAGSRCATADPAAAVAGEQSVAPPELA